MTRSSAGVKIRNKKSNIQADARGAWVRTYRLNTHFAVLFGGKKIVMKKKETIVMTSPR